MEATVLFGTFSAADIFLYLSSDCNIENVEKKLLYVCKIKYKNMCKYIKRKKKRYDNKNAQNMTFEINTKSRKSRIKKQKRSK